MAKTKRIRAVETVPAEAEKLRKLLTELKLIDIEYKVTKMNEKILIPIKKAAEEIKHLKIVEAKLEKLAKKHKKAVDILSTLSAKDKEAIPKSYDIVGDIAIVEIPDELKGEEKKIAEYIMSVNKSIKVVARKVGIHKGIYRTQDVEIIAGDKRKETTHKENGVEIKLNVETCYFSPRLSYERKRIAGLVKDGEDVLVMFSGVGPYPLVIAKNAKPRNIYGIELNPAAHKYAMENARKNRQNNIFLIKGDVKEVCRDMYRYIIGLKSSDDPKELVHRLKISPQIIELHLFEEDLHEKKKFLETSIADLQSKGIRVMLHMPFTCNGKKFSLAAKSAQNALPMLKTLGKICKKYGVGAVVHPSEHTGEKEDKDALVGNLRKLEGYYQFFYFENLTKGIYSRTDDILEISRLAGIRNACIDLAHLYMMHKNTDRMVGHIKQMQKEFHTYFHVNDCDGISHSTEIGKGKIDFKKILPYVNFGVVEVVSSDEFNPVEMIRSHKMIANTGASPKKFDRILMPLPKSAEDFLESAKLVSKKGSVIHFYDFVHENDMPHLSISRIKKHFPEAEILRWVKCGQYSPGKWRICVDFKV